MHRFVAAIAAITCFTTALPAQTVTPGQRVRIESPAVRGEFIVRSLAADTVLLEDRACATVHSVATRSISRMDVYAGEQSRGSRFLVGAGFGALIGGVSMAVVGYADGNDPPCQPQTIFDFCLQASAEEKGLIGLVGGGILGGLIGGVVGLTRSGERWERVPLQRIVISPAPSGFTAGVSLAF